MPDQKIQPDQKSKARNKITIIFIAVGAMIPSLSSCFLYLGEDPAFLLGGFIGWWGVTSIFAYFLYFLARWKLRPTFEENKKKFTRGTILAVLFLFYSLFSSFTHVKETVQENNVAIQDVKKFVSNIQYDQATGGYKWVNQNNSAEEGELGKIFASQIQYLEEENEKYLKANDEVGEVTINDNQDLKDLQKITEIRNNLQTLKKIETDYLNSNLTYFQNLKAAIDLYVKKNPSLFSTNFQKGFNEPLPAQQEHLKASHELMMAFLDAEIAYFDFILVTNPSIEIEPEGKITFATEEELAKHRQLQNEISLTSKAYEAEKENYNKTLTADFEKSKKEIEQIP